MDRPADDFKWFGEGFDGFPKRLPEDSVAYSLYVVSDGQSPKELHSQLEVIRKAAYKLADSLLKDYIWQRDSFRLEHKEEDGIAHLHGLTNYGDSVEDEWLIVYLLREISRTHEDLWIKIADTDGEFLLIEAANTLPRWLNPEIADNRVCSPAKDKLIIKVWINSNSLRIIPLKAETLSSATTRKPSNSLSLSNALDIIRHEGHILIHSPMVEEEAFYRLKKYPAQISASLHHACVTIPRKLAFILHSLSPAIAPAVEAFYLRDPIALKPLQSQSSQLTFPPRDLVTVSVRFTRVLFAQLKSQQFPPPVAWKDIVISGRSKIDEARLELGMKVTSGFEMLVGDSKNRDHRSVREIQILLQDLEDGETLPTDADIAGWTASSRDDDDSWLDINFEEFEKELSGEGAKKNDGVFGPEMMSGFGDAKTQDDLKKIVARFESFLNDDTAGPDGAELDDMDYDDDDDDAEDSDGLDSDGEDKAVSFDEREFKRMMREMMGLPPEDEPELAATGKSEPRSAPAGGSRQPAEELDEEDEQIRELMEKMETELRTAGALDLDPQQRASRERPLEDSTERQQPPPRRGGKGKEKVVSQEPHAAGDDAASESDSERSVDIDFNLAQNLLASFKAQAGMAGPGGNLMGMMGVRLPRDEEDMSPS